MIQHLTAKECLQGYTNEALGTMCQHWKLAASSRPSRIRAVERVVGDALHVTQALDELEPVALRTLSLMMRRENVAIGDILGVRGLIGNGQPAVPLRQLAERGLVLVCPRDRTGAFSFGQLTREWQANEAALWLTVPDTVRKCKLPMPAPERRLLAASSVLEPDGDAYRDQATSVFLEALRIVEVLTPRVTQTGEMHKSDETKAIEVAREAGFSGEALSLAIMMARRLGCVEVKHSRLTTTVKAASWVEGTRAERTRDLFDAYIDSEELLDLRLFFPDQYVAMERRLPYGSLRRTYHKELVAHILKEQAAADGHTEDAWYPVEALADAVYRADRNVLFLEERWQAVLVHTSDTSPSWQATAWYAHDRRLFSWMIQSVLMSLGVVALAEKGRLFSITPLGRYILGVSPAPEEEATPRANALVIQPDFEVIAYLEWCPPNLRRKLDTFCERVRGDIAVSTYRISCESVYRGVRAGTPVAEFVSLLETYSARSLPANVRMQLATWEQRLQAVVIRRACQVVECVAPADARELFATSPKARLLGDRHVLVEGKAPAVPLQIDYRRPLPACLRQEEGLALRVPWAEAHLFLQRCLADVGDVEIAENGDVIVRLSPAKTKRGDDWGLLLAQLEALAREPLASRYRMALQAWSGDTSPARVCVSPLVRFDDPAICEAVLELPELSALIEGRLGLYTLVVRPGSMRTLKRVLKEYGITMARNGPVTDERPPEEWAVRWVEERRSRHEERPSSASQPTGENAPCEEDIALPSYSPRIMCEILEDAIANRHPVLIQYQSAWGPRPAIRRVNPVMLDVVGPSPALSGYCHQLSGARAFRLAQIVGIRVLESEMF